MTRSVLAPGLIVLLLAGCEATTAYQSLEQPVVYGEDDRREYGELSDAWQDTADATAALFFSSAMLGLLGWMSGLATGLDLGQMVQISLLSLGMCCFASVLALGKIRHLEPAELF